MLLSSFFIHDPLAIITICVHGIEVNHTYMFESSSLFATLLKVGNVLIKLLRNEPYILFRLLVYLSFVLTVNKEITASLLNNITQKHYVHFVINIMQETGEPVARE